MERSIPRIQAAVVDGRARTPRFIQKQLTLLHDALTSTATAVHQAIVRDTGCSSSEAWYEIHMTLNAVKQHFASIDFRDFLQQEYSLAQGKDNPTRRTAYGCAYIVPSQNSRFYSTIQPVAAAITAGNCVVLEMQQTLLEVAQLIRKILTTALDKDTFAIVDQRPSSDKFFTDQVVISDTTSSIQASQSKILDSNSRRVVAVVDRSANISEAAKHLVRARFRFGGKSVYAPDVVFVNEFALKEFCQATVKFLTEELSETVTMNGTSKPQSSSSGKTLQQELQNLTTVLVSGARGSIHLLKQRNDTVLKKKVNEPLLIINPTTSLDDAIDNANSINSLLATYFFADPAATKYLSQFVVSDVSFSNHIPSQLLVGPAAPKDFPLSLNTRYTSEMFSRPSPEYIVPTTEDKALTAFLDDSPSKASIDKLKKELLKPLPEMGEPMTTTVGFFEQGLFTGLGIGATVLIGVLGVGARYTVPIMLRKIRG